MKLTDLVSVLTLWVFLTTAPKFNFKRNGPTDQKLYFVCLTWFGLVWFNCDLFPMGSS